MRDSDRASWGALLRPSHAGPGHPDEGLAVATAYSRPFSEALAALLPCYWIYAEVGKELKKSGSKDPVYRKWIAIYSSEGYGKTVQDVLAIADEVARSASQAELQHMRENFRRSCRYEWMFWDSAFHQRRWPPAVK